MPSLPPSPLSVDDPVGRALAVLTVRIYLQINPKALDLCHPVRFTSPEAAPVDARGSAELHSCVTWAPMGARLFTLMRVQGESLVYSHYTDTLYLASPQATLAASCPDDVGFLAQFCEDDGEVPRLLVFDLVGRQAASSENAKSRGHQLRSLASNLPTPMCTVQWVGWANPLRQFVPTLPHRVQYFLELTRDPLELIRINPW